MKNKSAFLFLLLTLGASLPANAQAAKATGNRPRTIGLTAAIQDNQFGFLVPIWLSEHFSISPAVEFQSAGKVASELGIGIVPKYYFKTEQVAPYAGLRAGAIFYNPADKNEINVTKTTDILVGGAFGADYFFFEKFSIGVELQGNFTISDENSFRFGNPGNVNFNTAAAVLVSVYF